MDKISLKIIGMTCESCEKIIGMELEELPGVKNIKINSKTGTGELEAPASVTNTDIETAITKAGYKGVMVGRVPVFESSPVAEDHTTHKMAALEGVVLPEKKSGKRPPFKVKLELTIESEDGAETTHFELNPQSTSPASRISPSTRV